MEVVLQNAKSRRLPLLSKINPATKTSAVGQLTNKVAMWLVLARLHTCAINGEANLRLSVLFTMPKY